MLLMFIDGAMSLTAMAILTVYLLWERFVAPRRALLHGVGLALIIYGIALAL
jgi:predicted metal-binding membrane protein